MTIYSSRVSKMQVPYVIYIRKAINENDCQQESRFADKMCSVWLSPPSFLCANLK